MAAATSTGGREVILSVPRYVQGEDDFACGPTCLCMCIDYLLSTKGAPKLDHSGQFASEEWSDLIGEGGQFASENWSTWVGRGGRLEVASVA